LEHVARELFVDALHERIEGRLFDCCVHRQLLDHALDELLLRLVRVVTRLLEFLEEVVDRLVIVLQQGQRIHVETNALYEGHGNVSRTNPRLQERARATRGGTSDSSTATTSSRPRRRARPRWDRGRRSPLTQQRAVRSTATWRAGRTRRHRRCAHETDV